VSTRGATFAVNDEWRARVLRELEAKGMSQRQLASAAGVSPVTITNLLQGRNHGSSAVPKIHRALGWPEPTVDSTVLVDERRERAQYVIRNLTDDSFRAAEALLDSLWETQRKSRS
jgi:transcriptional regulator with XRE-family HTH domain